MEKRFWKRVLAMVLVVTLAFPGLAQADTWIQQGDNWFVLKENTEGNSEYRTGWYQDERLDWYYLEPSPDAPVYGALKSGWLWEGGNWYFLNTVHDGFFGRLFTNTWLWIDGYCYYFDAQGRMAANVETPDHYTVNADGQWTVDGVVQHVPGKGILTKTAAGGSVGGSRGGGGGGSSSGGGGGSSSGGNGGSSSDNSDVTQTATLTIIYQDADTGQVLDTVLMNGMTGETAQISHPLFGGYEVLDGQPVEVVFGNGDTKIYVLYRKTLFVGGIEIRYMNKVDDTLLAVKNVSGLTGEDYIVHIPVIPGYKALTEEEEIVTFTEDPQAVTVEYRPLADNEDEEQRLVIADNVKVAQADSTAEYETLNEIYNGIFDYRQYEDGTVEIVVYNDNPILRNALDGDFKANDVIYIEPTEDFAAGLTFVYQSHDDDYSGEYDDYDAGACEVIHGFQASPFAIFGPGTNMEITGEDLEIVSRTEWSLAEESDEGFSVRSMKFSTRSTKADDSGNSIIKIPVPKWTLTKEQFLRILPERVRNSFSRSIKEFSNEISGSLIAEDYVLKIYNPLVTDEGRFFSTDKRFEFSMSPVISINNESVVEFDLENSNTLKWFSDDFWKDGKTKKLKNLLGGLWMEGIDFEEEGIFPIGAVGVDVITRKYTSKVKDLIVTGGRPVAELKSCHFYVGFAFCGVLNPAGKAEIKNKFSTKLSGFTIGIRYSEENGFENLTTANPLLSFSDELSCAVEADGRFGLAAYVIGSWGGTVPFAVGPEAGLMLDDASAKVSVSMEVDASSGKAKWSAKPEFGGVIAAYLSMRMHTRWVIGGWGWGTDKENEAELITFNTDLLKKEWPLIGSKTTDTGIEVRNEKDTFALCNENGESLSKTVSPVWDDAKGGWSFECPKYILKEVDGEEKAYRVTKLTVLPSGGGKDSWVELTLPDCITELDVRAKAAENFSCGYPAETLEKLSFTGAGSEMSELDVSMCEKLSYLSIVGTNAKTLDISKNSNLTKLVINSGLETFTGNGRAMPDKLKWYADADHTQPVERCEAGQTIYSGEEDDDEQGSGSDDEPGSVQSQGELLIESKSTSFYVIDKNGNDISPAWPGYDEETGMVSPFSDGDYGDYSIKIPQYACIVDENGQRREFEVYQVRINGGVNSVLDCSEAYGVAGVSISCGDYRSSPRNVILSESTEWISATADGRFSCDFSRAPQLREVRIRCDSMNDLYEVIDFDFRENSELTLFDLTSNGNAFSLKLPDNGESLEELRINNRNELQNYSFFAAENVGEIDYSNYWNLRVLDLYHLKSCTELDITSLSKLETLWLWDVSISELDLSGNPLLEFFSYRAYGGAIKDLDVSNNPYLETMSLKQTTQIRDGLIVFYRDEDLDLETFTGNGICFPDFGTWYSDETKQTEVTSCGSGQTIYSDLYFYDDLAEGQAVISLENDIEEELFFDGTESLPEDEQTRDKTELPSDEEDLYADGAENGREGDYLSGETEAELEEEFTSDEIESSSKEEEILDESGTIDDGQDSEKMDETDVHEETDIPNDGEETLAEKKEDETDNGKTIISDGQENDDSDMTEEIV